jgi:ribosomal protein S18 acetylase RimI-like enzyme
MSPVIQEISVAGLPAAGALLGRAMRDNPLHLRAVGPDPDRRAAVFGNIFGVMLTSLHPKGAILGASVDGRLVGICSYVRPGCCQPTAREKARLLGAVVRHASLGTTIQALRWLGSWARRDPPEPHWHLEPVGVEREWQGRGIGQALLREFCARVDAERGVAYLETDKEVNVQFYEKFGFRTVARAEVIGVPNWFMLRPPRT